MTGKKITYNHLNVNNNFNQSVLIITIIIKELYFTGQLNFIAYIRIMKIKIHKLVNIPLFLHLSCEMHRI